MTTLTAWIPPGVDQDRVDFDALEFRRAAITKGQALTWEMKTDCPCRNVRTFLGGNADSGEPNPTCTACRGSGAIYDAGQPVIAMMTRTAEQLKKYNLWGPSASGTTFLTLLPEQVPGYLDRYTLQSGIRVHDEVKTHATTVESLRYPITLRTMVVGNEYDPTVAENLVLGVLYCRVAGADGVIKAGVRVENVDFVVNTAGQIDWTLGEGLDTAPVVGERYGIRYYARPVFVVEDHEYVRRDLYMQDPLSGLIVHSAHVVEVMARLDFLGGINPPVAGVPTDSAFPPAAPYTSNG